MSCPVNHFVDALAAVLVGFLLLGYLQVYSKGRMSLPFIFLGHLQKTEVCTYAECL